jgi:hypothetical protein
MATGAARPAEQPDRSSSPTDEAITSEDTDVGTLVAEAG